MNILVEPLKAKIDGKDYFLELGIVRDTFLGREDHGIFTYTLEFDFNGSSQSAGNYFLNDPGRMGKHLQAVMNFLGSWESIKGRELYVMRETRYGPIEGLLRRDQSSYLIFSEVVNG